MPKKTKERSLSLKRLYAARDEWLKEIRAGKNKLTIEEKVIIPANITEYLEYVGKHRNSSKF